MVLSSHSWLRHPVRTGLRRSVALAGTLVLVALLGAAASACGEDTSPVNAAQRMTELLGGKPTGQAAAIAKRGQMTIANTEDYPPLSYRDDDGKLVGFDVEVGRAVAEYLSLTARFTQPPWEAVPAGLAGDRFDVSIGSLSPQQGLEGEVEYSKPYYYTTGQLVVRAGEAPLEGAEALAGTSVGASIHSVFYRWLQENTTAEVTAFQGDAEALGALESGKVEAVLTSGLVAAQAIKDGKGVETSGAPLFAEPMVFVVRAGEEDWLAVLNDAIAALRQEGKLAQLSSDWLGADFTKPKPSASAGE
jgi:polar amino acid transport system substrate-binding protein